ncbi:type VII toxin-antitoxin system HepT family RNase toxin [Thiohalocapsa marina]|uniref:type VII toxin-antitoxin system HepT family RNase toxin n=1 Tax=Thiohalocapsa marina TaxID=424902 RepID=UPI0036D989D8
MSSANAVIERKLGYLNRYLRDLSVYADLDQSARLREHYAIERLLQLLCECAADIALQRLKSAKDTLPTSYRETFQALERLDLLEPALAAELIKACGMRNILTHLYDDLDLTLVMNAIEPALDLYQRFAAWVMDWLSTAAGESPDRFT